MSSDRITLGELMIQPLVTIAADTSVAEALTIARIQRIHHMPVMEGSVLLGLVCTCDLRGALPDSAVAGRMRQPAVALDSSQSLQEAAQAMNEQKVGSVIVSFDGMAQGIITRGDLLAACPGMEARLSLARCESCGLTRHLSLDGDGHSWCIYCDPSECQIEGSAEFEPKRPATRAGTRTPHPLGSLIREHQLIGALAEALKVFASHVQSGTGTYDRADLGRFARVFRDFADCVHHEKEEVVLMPFLSRHGFDWDHGPLAEVRLEHQEERYLIDVLCQAAAREEIWNHEERRRIVSTARRLAEFQGAHLAKENTGLYRAVTERLDPMQLGQLRAELQSFDERVERYIPYSELTALAACLIARYLRSAGASSLQQPAGAAASGFSIQ
jgi:hemerythrin-like domain-containing protein/CBS domain-containing protein